jgi:hypothetical protein
MSAIERENRDICEVKNQRRKKSVMLLNAENHLYLQGVLVGICMSELIE